MSSVNVAVPVPPTSAPRRAEVRAWTVRQLHGFAAAMVVLTAAFIGPGLWLDWAGYSWTGRTLVGLAAVPLVAGVVATRKSQRLRDIADGWAEVL